MISVRTVWFPSGSCCPCWQNCSYISAPPDSQRDFIVDCLEQWWSSVRERFAHIRTLVINQDNGPENHSRRTQFLKRIVEFAHKYHLNIRLAYYPPYYSKYNPIERTWGVLEKHSLWQSLRRGRDSPQFGPDHDLERQAPYGDFD